MNRVTRSVLLLFLVAGLLGISFIAAGTEEKRAIAKGIKDFNTMIPSEFNAGQFVEGNVYEVFGEFAYMESYNETLGIKHGSKITSHYYLILLSGSFESDTPMFIALELKSPEAVENAELLLEQTVDYEINGTEPVIWNEFYVQGKLKKLGGELEEHLYSWLTSDGEDGTRADYEDMICPFVITERNVTSVEGDMTFGIVLTVICSAAAAAMLIIFIKARASSAQTSPYPDASYPPPRASDSFGNTTASGNISSPSDGGESARLMEKLSRLSQPADPDDFFSGPISKKHDDSGLGTGIADDDK
ncbi:MAG: hypothetical protein MSJ26_08930 [Oscillospiraceae bacterium]|nr:hypothetical protein [Oscillospiraceae bacterium]